MERNLLETCKKANIDIRGLNAITALPIGTKMRNEKHAGIKSLIFYKTDTRCNTLQQEQRRLIAGIQADILFSRIVPLPVEQLENTAYLILLIKRKEVILEEGIIDKEDILCMEVTACTCTQVKRSAR